MLDHRLTREELRVALLIRKGWIGLLRSACAGNTPETVIISDSFRWRRVGALEYILQFGKQIGHFGEKEWNTLDLVVNPYKTIPIQKRSKPWEGFTLPTIKERSAYGHGRN